MAIKVKNEWTGFEERECGEHRTTGLRAWCFACSEWCYPESACAGCERPRLDRVLDAARNAVHDGSGKHMAALAKALKELEAIGG